MMHGRAAQKGHGARNYCPADVVGAVAGISPRLLKLALVNNSQWPSRNSTQRVPLGWAVLSHATAIFETDLSLDHVPGGSTN